MTTYYTYYENPASRIGKLLLAGNGDSLELLGFPQGNMARRHESGWRKDEAPFTDCIQQLDEYFAGTRLAFTVPVTLHGTDFQKEVWQALTRIPYGETWSYGQLAGYIGRPNASRAVGAANGMNPVPIIVPCHRVIGSNGKLTGFGGGLDTKRELLGLESASRAPGLGF